MRQSLALTVNQSIEPDRRCHQQDIAEAVAPAEDHGGQDEFDDGRTRVQDGEADDGLDALGAALDDARKPPVRRSRWKRSDRSWRWTKVR